MTYQPLEVTWLRKARLIGFVIVLCGPLYSLTLKSITNYAQLAKVVNLSSYSTRGSGKYPLVPRVAGRCDQSLRVQNSVSSLYTRAVSD